MAGEEWNGIECEKCQIDQYKSSIGNNISCETCPQNETAPEEGYSNCGETYYENYACIKVATYEMYLCKEKNCITKHFHLDLSHKI